MQVWPVVILSIMAQRRGLRADELLPDTFTPASVFYFFNSLLHLANISVVAIAIAGVAPTISLELSLSCFLCLPG